MTLFLAKPRNYHWKRQTFENDPGCGKYPKGQPSSPHYRQIDQPVKIDRTDDDGVEKANRGKTNVDRAKKLPRKAGAKPGEEPKREFHVMA